jgi:hypothetical protein
MSVCGWQTHTMEGFLVHIKFYVNATFLLLNNKFCVSYSYPGRLLVFEYS